MGYMFEGEIYVWYPNVYGSVGETFLLKADYTAYFSDFIGLGGYINYGNPYYSGFGEISMAELGVVFKGRFQIGEKMLAKFPPYVGYRTYGNDAGQGLGINLSSVLEYQASEKIKPFLDVGFLTQPTGGNDFSDMTFGPTAAVTLGVAFSF